MPAAGVTRLRELGNLRGHRPRHHAGRELDHIDLEALRRARSRRIRAR